MSRHRRIIAFTGCAGAGKDTCCDYLVQQHGFKKLSFAEPLREALLALDPWVYCCIPGRPYARLSDLVGPLGWDTCKRDLPDVRQYLQKLGTEVGRQIIGDRCWVDIAQRKLLKEPDQDFAISDMRFPNEVDLVDQFGGYKIIVERPGCEPSNGHVSDTGVRSLPVDETFANHLLDTSELGPFLDGVLARI